MNVLFRTLLMIAALAAISFGQIHVEMSSVVVGQACTAKFYFHDPDCFYISHQINHIVAGNRTPIQNTQSPTNPQAYDFTVPSASVGDHVEFVVEFWCPHRGNSKATVTHGMLSSGGFPDHTNFTPSPMPLPSTPPSVIVTELNQSGTAGRIDGGDILTITHTAPAPVSQHWYLDTFVIDISCPGVPPVPLHVNGPSPSGSYTVVVPSGYDGKHINYRVGWKFYPPGEPDPLDVRSWVFTQKIGDANSYPQ